MSSPILVKVHFDVVLTMIADTLYYLLAQRLRGFEECNAPQIFRHFIQGKGQVTATGDEILVRYPKRAHNPLLRAVPWNKLPRSASAGSETGGSAWSGSRDGGAGCPTGSYRNLSVKPPRKSVLRGQVVGAGLRPVIRTTPVGLPLRANQAGIAERHFASEGE